VLEPKALGQVVELDVDAKVVGVHLELIAGHQRAVLVNHQGHGGHFALHL